MDPITIASLIALGGTALNAFGQYTAGQKAQAIGEINADSILNVAETNAQLVEQGTADNTEIALYNSRMAEARSRDAVRRGAENERKFRTQLRGALGTQRTSYAGQGIDVGFGSPVEVGASSAYQGELDALTIRTNAAREAWGFQVESYDAYMQAQAIKKQGALRAKSVRDTARAESLSSRMGGNAAASAGTYGAAASIIGGTSNIMYQRYGWKT